MSININASNKEILHEGSAEARPLLPDTESSEESEASSPGVTESPGVTAPSPGVKGNGPWRSGRVRAKPHLYSISDWIKQVHLQHKKGKTKFYKGDETKILAIVMCQIESQEMANRKKKDKKCYFFAQAHSLKVGLKKFGKRDKYGAHKEVK